jgi:hypothetical protein
VAENGAEMVHWPGDESSGFDYRAAREAQRVMRENGAEVARSWQPAHDGCSVVYRSINDGWYTIKIVWTRPHVQGLERVVHMGISGPVLGTPEDIFDDMDRQFQDRIDWQVHQDSVLLLARGNRGQRADTERFEAEQKGEPCRT